MSYLASTLAWAAAAMAVGALLAGWLRPRSARAPALRADGGEQLQGVVAGVVPVWCRQIRTARSTGDEAVRDLTGAFGTISRELESSLEKTRILQAALAADGGALAATRDCRHDLQRIVESLGAAEGSRAKALAQVGELASGLRETMREMNQLALQTRLIALNAGIEANRFGPAGRAFGVVAGEVERLARDTEQASARMQAQTHAIAHTVATLGGEGGQMEGVRTIEEAQRATTRVIERFEEVTTLLGEGVKRLESESGRVHGGLSDALVALQFQDRVSQVLDHVAGELEGFARALAAGRGTPSAIERWQGTLGRDYSMREEFDNVAAAEPARAALPGAVTYF